ncbi:MAG: hypothetical protein OEW21_12395, partial [Betaproteobacteria bacterium]|nr:hypothetical protein [Betaproteobacteria bacterium]
ACPEKIPLVDMILELRRAAPLFATGFSDAARNPASGTVLLAGAALGGERLQRSARLLGAVVAADDGADLALALETGTPIPPARLTQFLDGLRAARRLVVGEGLLLRRLKEWLPGIPAESLAAALLRRGALRAKLTHTDLYVIEPRSFHGDHATLVGQYDALQRATGCMTNLDLQRFAVPTTAGIAQRALGLPAIDAAAQARWILAGREVARIVVEDAADLAVFAAVTDRPVLHLADLA